MIIKFNREEEWKFEKLTGRKGYADKKRRERNSQLFVDWVMTLLKNTAPRELEKGERYTSTKIYIHPEHNEFLNKHIDPFIWLNYSPVDDDTVGLDEIKITEWFEEVDV